MRSTVFSAAGTVTGALFLATAAFSVPAHAAEGEVTVFGTEVTPLTNYADPVGCHKLPLDAHVLTNRTDGPVTIYGDPFCLTPGLTVQPGYGSHVAPGSGSFSA
ncbi:hypothetical protein FH609_027310 [Streptomyces sp. 3MP-14]|uniref:Uncharacterized protein n=1 Tax=Streptomyces mimosae TaxID=2586635 RepID=A0A5N5ZYA2_9ACTN|nr:MULTISPECIES: hypothetical protein [Streptomyces]KAB8161255.1 hypothetical protein FH607_025805 [Streptomyces mimosae]KAB8173057.1 hypothetical protein FH609_027310 [Streptomyces sp. 3MP-14]